jgi:hypothetical protein
MPHTFHLDHRDLIVDRWFPDRIYLPRPAHVRILVVVEPGIAPGPPGAGFGLGRVVSYLRNETFGFVNFQVDFAERGTDPSPDAVMVDTTPGDWGFRYANFRFHSVHDGQPIIHGYDQVWCFGIEPFIHDEGNNASVQSSAYSPTNEEVAVLSAWMDAGGGVLAMGDHNFLGSAMCWKIPRVGTMRAWLKDANDGRSVPNRTGTDRHDTNRPQNAAQDASVTVTPAVMPDGVERDTVTQPLDWKRYTVASFVAFRARHRPHPVLCGGSLGVIDRFPDHPHEGLVIHESLINLGAKCTHDPAKDEYPTVGGAQPRPEVVAWVDTLPSPPYQHAKGAQPARHFPAIGVYDGHSIEHGRVLVDSTWHHWFDMNIAALEAANSTDFQKIKRYFQNVAIWLAPRRAQQRMLAHATFWTVLSPSAFEELTIDTPILRLGGSAIDILGQATSDCLVTTWLLDRLPFEIIEMIREPPRPFPEPCWSCPPEDIFTQAVMGGVVKRLLPYRDELLRNARTQKGGGKPKFDPEELVAAIDEGVATGLEVALKAIEANRESLEHAVRTTRDAVGRIRTACDPKQAG